MNKAIKLLCAVIVSLGLLVGCAYPADNEPVVTEDRITPNNTADQIVEMAQQADNFPYIWHAQNPDETKALIEAGLMQNLSNFGSFDEYVNEQLSYSPEIDAQTVANMAGAIMVENYGYTPGTEMPYGLTELDYTDGNLPPMELQLVKGENDELWWIINAYSNDFYPATLDEMHGYFTIDAMTGQLLICQFMNYNKDAVAIQASPIDASFVVTQEDFNGGFVKGYFDTESPEFGTMLEKKMGDITENLNGSPLCEGATVVDITLSKDITPAGETFDFLLFDITLSNGRTMQLSEGGYDAPYSEYNYNGSPLWNGSAMYIV